jgi:rod shape-determining protein MreB
MFLAWKPKIAVDVGSYRTRIVNVGRKEEIDDFSVVTLRRKKKGEEVLEAVGQEALDRAERRADLELIWPLSKGEIDDYHAAVVMLHGYCQKLHLGLRLGVPWVVIAKPAGKLEHIARANFDLATESLHANVVLMTDLFAVAINEGIDQSLSETEPRFMLHMGAGYGVAGMFVAGHFEKNCYIRQAGEWLDVNIQRHLYDALGCLVSLGTCRTIKHEIGDLQGDDSLTWNSAVADVEGHMHTLALSSADLRPVLSKAFAPIVEELRWFIKTLPADQVYAARQKGILLSGGCAEMRGLPSWLAQQLDWPVQVAHDPSRAVIQGVTKLMATPSRWSSVPQTLRKLTQSTK